MKVRFVLCCVLFVSFNTLGFSKHFSSLAIDLNNEKLDLAQRQIAQKRFHLDHSANYYYALAQKLQLQDRQRDAVKYYEYSILVDNTNGLPYFNLGQIYYSLRLFEESLAYLNSALKKTFEFEFDKIRSQYLLITVYFCLGQPENALKYLSKLVDEYQSNIDRQAINGLSVKYEYYAPAFFLLTLYYRNNGVLEEHLEIAQKALQLGFKKEYVDYFFYEYYESKSQDSIAWEYLNQAKKIDPKIEEHATQMPWLQSYDIYQDIES